MIGNLASWVLSAASESAYDAAQPIAAWQRCKRCGLKVDLPEDVLKAAEAAYCSEACLPPVPYGQVDVSRLRPMRMR